MLETKIFEDEDKKIVTIFDSNLQKLMEFESCDTESRLRKIINLNFGKCKSIIREKERHRKS